MAGAGAEAGCDLGPLAGLPMFAVLCGGLGEGEGEGDFGGGWDLHRREGLGSTSLYGGGGGGVTEMSFQLHCGRLGGGREGGGWSGITTVAEWVD